MKTLIIIASLIASFQFIALPMVSADITNTMSDLQSKNYSNTRDARISKALSE